MEIIFPVAIMIFFSDKYLAINAYKIKSGILYCPLHHTVITSSEGCVSGLCSGSCTAWVGYDMRGGDKKGKGEEGRSACRQAERRNRNTERKREKDAGIEKGKKRGSACGREWQPHGWRTGAGMPGKERDTGGMEWEPRTEARRRAVAPGTGCWQVL